MDTLPDDAIFQIILLQSIKDIGRMCQVNKRLNNLLNNNSFWREKFTRDFGDPNKNLNILLWKIAYQNYGTVAVIGSNESGQLGLGSIKHICNLTLITNIRAKAVSCGTSHTIIIDLNDNVWAFGYNSSGQLGLGDFETRYKPTKILDIKAKSVFCGGTHTMIIDLDNNLWGFGSNQYHQLGIDDFPNKPVPTKVGIKAKDGSCGDEYTMIIDLDDNLWGFGSNDLRQLGLNTIWDRNMPTKIPNLKAKYVSCIGRSTKIIDINGNVYFFGYQYHSQLDDTYKHSIKIHGAQIIIDLDDNIWTDIDSCVLIQIPNVKAKAISYSVHHAVIVFEPTSQVAPNVRLISFFEAVNKLSNGEFVNFNFLPEYQTIPHKSENYIASFYGKDGNVYLVELRYDQVTNNILAPK